MNVMTLSTLTTHKISTFRSHTLILTIALVFLFCISLNAQDTVITNYPGTNQRWEKVFSQDEKIAENIFHANGTPWMTVKYDNQVEDWNWYHENNNPFFSATISNQKIEGNYTVWYENGQIAEELIFSNNLENGPAIFYYPNGQIAMQGQYELGEMTGEWTFFNPDGTPPDGSWEWYFAALPDDIRISGHLKNGRPVGMWKYSTTARKDKNYPSVLIWDY